MLGSLTFGLGTYATEDGLGMGGGIGSPIPLITGSIVLELTELKS